MRYLSSSMSNLTILHIVLSLCTLVGFYYCDFTLANILTTTFFYFMYMGVGIGMTLHRYYTHKCFVFKYTWTRYLATFCAILAGRGSILGWVYVHRVHHAYSDTENDPHSPVFKGHRVLFPHLVDYPEKINRGLVKDLLNREQVNIDKYYMLYILSWIILLSLFGFNMLYFVYILPVTMSKLLWNTFTYYSHMHGYRNYDTRDNSRNSILFNVLLFGEGMHNNHHYNASRSDWQDHWYEFDVIGKLINLIKKEENDKI